MLAMELATYADADGSRIFPAVGTLARAFGWSRRKTFYILDDLKSLGLLFDNHERHGEHGTKVRVLNVERLRAEMQSTPEAEMQSTSTKVQSTDSRSAEYAEQKCNDSVAHNRSPEGTPDRPTHRPGTSDAAPDGDGEDPYSGRQEGRSVSDSKPAGRAEQAGALAEFWVRVQRYFGETRRDLTLNADKEGKAKIEKRIVEHGIEKVERCFRAWLPSAELKGCRFVLAKFDREFEDARAKLRANIEDEKAAQAANAPVSAEVREEERLRHLKEMGITDEEYATDIMGMSREVYRELRPDGASWQQFLNALESKRGEQL